MKGYLLLALAFVTCPCHLPLVLVALAGTGLAGLLSQHFWLAFVVLGVVFVTSLTSGLKTLNGNVKRRV